MYALTGTLLARLCIHETVKVHRVGVSPSGVLGCHHVAVGTAIHAFGYVVIRLGYLSWVVYCRHGACPLYRQESRLQPSRLLCRRRSFIWVSFFFGQSFCRCRSSRSRDLLKWIGYLLRCARSLLRRPSYWRAPITGRGFRP